MSNAWKAGLVKSKSDENIMHNLMNLDTKNNRTKFKSLDKCLSTSMTSLRTYLKSHPNKRQKIESVTLIPITFVELKEKQENES